MYSTTSASKKEKEKNKLVPKEKLVKPSQKSQILTFSSFAQMLR